MTFARGQGAVVVDASVAVEILKADEGWLERWQAWADAGTMLLAPAHFPAEVANALLRSVRMTASESVVRLARLPRLQIASTDRGPAGLERAVDLAERHRLTVYDAIYLDLAIDVDGDLASLDRSLVAAARAEGVSIAP